MRLLLLAFLSPFTLVLAQSLDDPGPLEDRSARTVAALRAPELDKASLEAIEQGLAFLARRQSPMSGHWQGPGNTSYNMSLTALAGLAFLAHGEQPGRGPHGVLLEKAIRYVLTNQWPDSRGDAAGLFFDKAQLGREDRTMHGHGFATLFLAEAYGQASSPRLREQIREALVKAVRLTERSQSLEGGWYYLPNDGRDEGSVTVTQIQGMRAARNAGVLVSKKTIDKAVDYIRRSQNQDGSRRGGVRYTIYRGDPSPALTAAGIEVFYGAGEYDSPGIALGFEYLEKNMRTGDKHPFWFYTHLFAAQAYFQKGGAEWRSYFTELRRTLLARRGARGEWGTDDEPVGPVFATACAVLCLEIPLQYLPIFQR